MYKKFKKTGCLHIFKSHTWKVKVWNCHKIWDLILFGSVWKAECWDTLEWNVGFSSAPLTSGSCSCGSCGWGFGPSGRPRCRYGPAPSSMSVPRCSRCTIAPSHPGTSAQTGRQCTQKGRQSPALWFLEVQRHPPTEQFLPLSPWSQRRPGPVYSEIGRRTFYTRNVGKSLA